MEIKNVPITKVDPWDKNPRGVKKADFERLKAQIKKLGVYKPLICYEEKGRFIVLGGNMRIRALKDLGYQDVDISVVKPKSKAQIIEYALSDNDRVGFYEEDKLAELVFPEMGNLDLDQYKIDIGEPTGLKKLLDGYGPSVEGEDQVPEADDSPAKTKPGDLFTLGRHRLLCGDSTKAADMERLTKGEKFGVLADPPYNCGFHYRLRKDDDKADKWQEFCDLWFGLWSKKAEAVILTPGPMNERRYPEPRDRAVWIKRFSRSGASCFHLRKTEPIMFYGEFPEKRTDDVFEYGMSSGQGLEGIEEETGIERAFPPAKPVALWEELAKMLPAIVSDPFLGTGTTLIAAEKTGRSCFGMEIDPKYCDLIIKRYADYKGTSEASIRKTRERPNEKAGRKEA